MEILRMDDKSVQLYIEALQDGKEKVYNIRVMVVGQYGVGKTTLTKRILGLHVDISKRKSTEGIDIYKQCCNIPLDTGEWIVQHEDSEQLARLQRLVKLLTNQAERLEVSGEEEGHQEVIDQNFFNDVDDDDTPSSTNASYDAFSNADNDDIPASSRSDIHQEVGITSNLPEKLSFVNEDHRPPGLAAISIPMLESTRDMTSSCDAIIEFLQLVNENADKLKKSIDEYAALSMWDFAGQYVFYTTHQTFLTHRAIYLLVTDLSQQFTDLVRDDQCYFDAEGLSLCQVQDLVEVWLNSIHCCAPPQEDNTLGMSPTAASADTSPSSGVMVTSSAVGITATSQAACTTVTTPSTCTTVTTKAACTTVPSAAAGIMLSSAPTRIAADTTMAYTANDAAMASLGAHSKTTYTDVDIPLTPPVILVGTHVDKIREDKRQEVIRMYFPQICRILNDKPALRHVATFVAIDNTQPDPQLGTLKRRILKLAEEQPYWGEEVPTSWLPMEEALMKLKATGKKVILRSLVEELNQAASVPIKTAEQLDLFLRFQHEIGTILYFSVDGLKEKIVLDPQWFIDALKSLITAEMFVLEKYPAIRNKWFELRDNGKLTPELINAIWTRGNYPDLYENKEHVLLLMEKLNIIAKPRSYIKDRDELKEENYYLAPCMLREKTPGEVTNPKPSDHMESSSVLCYVFTGKFLPSPIFHRLLAACVARWPIATKKKEEMQENLIFCGCGVFQLDHYHKLTIHFREYVIFVRVTRMGIKNKTPSSKLCIQVRSFITSMLFSIIGCLRQNLKFEHFIQCPEYHGDCINSLIPVSLLKVNPEVRCDFHDNIIESCTILKFWFEDHQEREIEHRESSGPEESQGDQGQCYDYMPITHEHLNHTRLYNALTTVCADALREILIDQVPVPYANIYQAILVKEEYLTSKQFLNNDQINVIFPDTPGTTGTVDQFDTSLLYTLIRNVSSVHAPATGWGNYPADQPKRDTSLGASVERIRLLRNKVSGHSVDGKISDTEFMDYWQNIDQVLQDIEHAIGIRGYREQLERCKNQAIASYEVRNLQIQIQEYEKQVEDAKGKLHAALEAVQKL